MPSPQLQKLLESFGHTSANPPTTQDGIIAAYRQESSNIWAVDGSTPTIAELTAVERVSAGGVPSEWVLAEAANPELRIMHIHGGGFIAGTNDRYRHVAEALSRVSGNRIRTT